MPHWTKVLIHGPEDKRGNQHSYSEVRSFHQGWKDLKHGEPLEENTAKALLEIGEKGISRPWKEAGFHWAIARVDGVVEIIMLRPMTQNGSHAREHNLNKTAIGIFCEEFTEDFIERLVVLVKFLRKIYKIPTDSILGRWEVNPLKPQPAGASIEAVRQRIAESAGETSYD
jgi:hypothetical protein